MTMIGKDDLTIIQAVTMFVLCDATDLHPTAEAPQGREKRMRTYEISSPNAAELYFRDSILGHVAMLLAEALGATRKSRRAPRRAETRAAVVKPVAKPVAPPRAGWLDRLDAWFWRQEQKDREAYLAESRDIFELERRIELLDREGIARYY